MTTFENEIARPDCLSAMQITEVRECHVKDRVALEQTFVNVGISTLVDKAETLLKAMGIQENDYVFYSGASDGCPAEEERFEAIVGAFFSGAWK